MAKQNNVIYLTERTKLTPTLLKGRSEEDFDRVDPKQLSKILKQERIDKLKAQIKSLSLEREVLILDEDQIKNLSRGEYRLVLNNSDGVLGPYKPETECLLLNYRGDRRGRIIFKEYNHTPDKNKTDITIYVNMIYGWKKDHQLK